MTVRKIKENNLVMARSYEPSLCEDKLYKLWEDSGYFNPDNLNLDKNTKPYTIILPPPNVTDKLHLGHACMLAIEDLLIRFHRMDGYRTLWLPGTDHAAIATQNVVEKKILNEEGKSRHDLGREKFLEKVWEFLIENQSMILHQTKKMGSSLDWSRQAFTLDEKRIKAVRKMFIDMYNEGIVYRGERIINWCPRCKSTLASDEIEYKENKSKLYAFKYSSDFPFAIATTRPETKLGDTAVAVNPKDKRYKDFIGKTIKTDFLGIKLKIKIIGDWKVKTNFGTGALGVTPAHSMVDWKIAEENDLEIIKVINEEGKIRDGFGEFSGLNVLEAREKIVKKLKEKELLIKENEIDNNLSCCYRCGTLIEQLPSLQWFVNVDKKLERLGNKSLKERAVEVAVLGKIKFNPKRFTKRYIDWIENLHDWCISRQIWFGHRIPVYYKNKEIYVGENKPLDKGWTQDPDSLDTWFSSGMWTFSTLGWPENFKNGKKINDLAKFHPTQMLETGHEIITLWVSRMIIMSIFALGEIPFENVYLHGLILDKTGKKMSKSKGNGINPLDVIEKFGTDAVRLSLLTGSTPGNDVRFDEVKIEKQKNYINKIWNIARYLILNYEIKNYQSDQQIIDTKISEKSLTNFDKWILDKMQTLIKQVSDDLNKYRFSQAGEKLHNFTWNDLADWYLEVCKFEKNKSKKDVLIYILTNLLKLHHPFIPFVTEKIWSFIFDNNNKENLLMVAKWPKIKPELKSKKTSRNKEIEIIKGIIIAIRNARSENKIEPSCKVKAVIYTGNKIALIKSQELLIKNLKTGIEKLEIKKTGKKIKNAIYISVIDMRIYLIGTVDEEVEKTRLNKEIKILGKLVRNQKNKFKNSDFVNKAPEFIVTREKEKLEQLTIQLNSLKKRLQQRHLN